MGRTHHDELASGSAAEEGMVVHSDGSITLKPQDAPGGPEEGQIYYDSSAKKLKVYSGTAWETITSS